MSPGEPDTVPPELKALEDIIGAGTLMVKREGGTQREAYQSAMAWPISAGESSWMKWTPLTVTYRWAPAMAMHGAEAQHISW